MKLRLAILMLTLFILTVVPLSAQSNDENPLADTGWAVTDFGDPAQMPMDTMLPYVVFMADGSLGGSDSCNNFFGSYTVDGDNLTINQPIGATMKLCPESTMQIASDFMSRLSNAASFEITDDMHMTITTADGEVINFIRSLSAEAEAGIGAPSENALADTGWAVTNFGDPLGVPMDIMLPYVVFMADGSLSGNDTCNNFFGSYTVDGDNLTISQPMGATMKLCPETSMQIASDFMSRLSNAASFEITDDMHITITTTDGEVINFIRSRSAEAEAGIGAPSENALADTGWAVINFGDPVGVPMDIGLPVVVFLADGSVVGNDTCNNFFGDYEVNGNSLTINEPLGSTMMACPETTSDIAAQFMSLFMQAESFELTDEMHMTITSADGGVINFIRSRSAEAQAGIPGDADMEGNALADTGWSLSSYTVEGRPAPLPADFRLPYVVFVADGSLSGNNSCNTFFGSYEASGNSLTINEPLGSTRMACMGPAEQISRDFMRLFADAASFAFEDDMHMVITTNAGEEIRFIRSRAAEVEAGISEPAGVAVESASPLVGTAWELVSYGLPGANILPVEISPAPNMSFNEDGSLTGGGGCNTFFTTYIASDNTLYVREPLGTTRMLCVDEIMAVENEFFSLLTSAETIEFTDDGGLVVSTPDGRILTFAPIPFEGETNPLLNTGWILESYGAPAETGVVVDAENAPFVNFKVDGVVNGNGGCNNFFSDYVATDNTLTVREPLATTRMMCEQSVMDVENEFFTLFVASATFDVNDEGNLIVTTADGRELRFVPGNE